MLGAIQVIAKRASTTVPSSKSCLNETSKPRAVVTLVCRILYVPDFAAASCQAPVPSYVPTNRSIVFTRLVRSRRSVVSGLGRTGVFGFSRTGRRIFEHVERGARERAHIAPVHARS